MAAEAHAPTAGEYIIHHLTHLQNQKQKAVVDFSVFNFDSIFWAVLVGVIGCWLLWRAARSATAGVPGRFQAAVEILIEIVDSVPRSCRRPGPFDRRSRTPRQRRRPGWRALRRPRFGRLGGRGATATAKKVGPAFVVELLVPVGVVDPLVQALA